MRLREASPCDAQKTKPGAIVAVRRPGELEGTDARRYASACAYRLFSRRRCSAAVREDLGFHRAWLLAPGLQLLRRTLARSTRIFGRAGGASCSWRGRSRPCPSAGVRLLLHARSVAFWPRFHPSSTPPKSRPSKASDSLGSRS